jgi:polyhydroxybutyrate depolymerase
VHVDTCPGGATVQLYVVEGGGHTWPGSQFSQAGVAALGPTTFDIDANQVIWAFFQAHPMPR